MPPSAAIPKCPTHGERLTRITLRQGDTVYGDYVRCCRCAYRRYRCTGCDCYVATLATHSCVTS